MSKMCMNCGNNECDECHDANYPVNWKAKEPTGNLPIPSGSDGEPDNERKKTEMTQAEYDELDRHIKENPDCECDFCEDVRYAEGGGT